MDRHETDQASGYVIIASSGSRGISTRRISFRYKGNRKRRAKTAGRPIAAPANKSTAMINSRDNSAPGCLAGEDKEAARAVSNERDVNERDRQRKGRWRPGRVIIRQAWRFVMAKVLNE